MHWRLFNSLELGLSDDFEDALVINVVLASVVNSFELGLSDDFEDALVRKMV